MTDPIERCDSPRGGDRWRDVALFGLSPRTNFPFATGLAASHGPPELTFALVAQPPRRLEWDGLSPVYESAHRLTDGRSALRIFRLPDLDVLHFPDEADFYCFPDRIVCHAVDDGAMSEIESPLCIACLYLPERQETGTIAIEPLRPHRAIAELIGHSFAPRMVQALGGRGAGWVSLRGCCGRSPCGGRPTRAGSIASMRCGMPLTTTCASIVRG